LLNGGTEAQKGRWLPPIAAGEIMVAISVTEPDTGSDVASVRCRAERVEGGWCISGAKAWCTFAGRANVIALLARTNPDPAARAMDADEKVSLEPAMAKLFASDVAVWVTQEGQLLHGGWGYAEEFPISRHVVDALVLPIFEGVKPILELKVIARKLLGG